MSALKHSYFKLLQSVFMRPQVLRSGRWCPH